MKQENHDTKDNKDGTVINRNTNNKETNENTINNNTKTIKT